MKIRFIKQINVEGKDYFPYTQRDASGEQTFAQEFEFDDDMAIDLIKLGFAEEAPGQVKAKAIEPKRKFGDLEGESK